MWVRRVVGSIERLVLGVAMSIMLSVVERSLMSQGEMGRTQRILRRLRSHV